MKRYLGSSGLSTASACIAVLLAFGTSSMPVGARQVGPTPTASPAGAPSAPQSGDAARAIAAFARAWANLTGYSATVTIFDRKGTQTQNVVFDYTFHKPSNVTVHVVAGSNAGVTLTWNGGPTVVARRGSGLAALFTKTMSLHDSLVTTLRGSSIDQLSFGAILAYGQQQGGSLSASAQVLDGAAINAVTLIPADPKTNAGLTREVVALSAATHLPVRVLGYEGNTLVRQVDFSNVKLQS